MSTHCDHPAKSVTISPDGHFRICCYGESISSVKDQTIREFFNSDAVRAIKDSLDSGHRHPYCQACWQVEDMGHRSYRQDGVPFKVTGDFPAQLDIKFNNVCNLACKMCDPVSSSTLSKEWKELGWVDKDTPYLDTNSKTIKPDWHTVDYQINKRLKLFDEILENIQHVRRIKFTGGEPFMTLDILRFLKQVPLQHRKNIKLAWTTNGTRDISPWIDTLKTYQKNQMGLSCDGEGDTYDYVRYPNTWSEWLNSSTQITENFKWHINCTVTIFNVFNLPKFIAWAEGRGIFDRVRFAYENIPAMYSPEVLPRSLRNKAAITIRQSTSRTDLLSIAKQIEDADDLAHHTHWQHFIKTTQQQDKHRGMSITKIWPDVPELRKA